MIVGEPPDVHNGGTALGTSLPYRPNRPGRVNRKTATVTTQIAMPMTETRKSQYSRREQATAPSTILPRVPTTKQNTSKNACANPPQSRG